MHRSSTSLQRLSASVALVAMHSGWFQVGCEHASGCVSLTVKLPCTDLDTFLLHSTWSFQARLVLRQVKLQPTRVAKELTLNPVTENIFM